MTTVSYKALLSAAILFRLTSGYETCTNLSGCAHISSTRFCSISVGNETQLVVNASLAIGGDITAQTVKSHNFDMLQLRVDEQEKEIERLKDVVALQNRSSQHLMAVGIFLLLSAVSECAAGLGGFLLLHHTPCQTILFSK